MKTCIYHGPDTALGRFGTVREGDHLQLLESEYACVAQDERFECISRRKPARPIFPLGTPPYDLRLIRWEHPELVSWLLSQGRSQLALIVAALDFVGVKIVHTVHDSEEMVADAIYGEAKDLGWTKMTEDQRLALGTTATAEDEENSGEGGDSGQDGGDVDSDLPEADPMGENEASEEEAATEEAATEEAPAPVKPKAARKK